MVTEASRRWPLMAVLSAAYGHRSLRMTFSVNPRLLCFQIKCKDVSLQVLGLSESSSKSGPSCHPRCSRSWTPAEESSPQQAGPPGCPGHLRPRGGLLDAWLGGDAHPRMEENVAALLPPPSSSRGGGSPRTLQENHANGGKSPGAHGQRKQSTVHPHSGMFFNLKKRGRQFPLWCTGIGNVLGAVDAGSRPGLAQWMKDLPLLQLWLRCTASVAWIRSLGELHMPRGAPPQKSKDICTQATTQLNLQDIVRSEIRQSQKDK